METDFRKMATEMWHKVSDRIKHMSDYKNGTHAQHCIDDIETALRKVHNDVVEKCASIIETPVKNEWGEPCWPNAGKRAIQLRSLKKEASRE